MKLRGRSPSCGIYYLEPLRAKRGAEEPVGKTLTKLEPILILILPLLLYHRLYKKSIKNMYKI